MCPRARGHVCVRVHSDQSSQTLLFQRHAISAMRAGLLEADICIQCVVSVCLLYSRHDSQAKSRWFVFDNSYRQFKLLHFSSLFTLLSLLFLLGAQRASFHAFLGCDDDRGLVFIFIEIQIFFLRSAKSSFAADGNLCALFAEGHDLIVPADMVRFDCCVASRKSLASLLLIGQLLGSRRFCLPCEWTKGQCNRLLGGSSVQSLRFHFHVCETQAVFARKQARNTRAIYASAS